MSTHKPTIFLTGASRGLGRAIALELAKKGADLALFARSLKGLQETQELILEQSPQCTTYLGDTDISDYDTFKEKLEQACQQFGRVDGVIHNAALVQPVAPIAELDLKAWDKQFQINVSAALLACQITIPYLRESQGTIVMLGTGASTFPIPGMSAYCTTKAGLAHFARVLAHEENQITTLTIQPGVVDTGMQKDIREFGKESMPEGMYQYFNDLHKKGELVAPELPAQAIAWATLKAPANWSGKELSYDDPLVARPSKRFFRRG